MNRPEVDLPGVNWLVHVLKKTGRFGLAIDLGPEVGGSKDYVAQFTDERMKGLFLDMATLFDYYDNETCRLTLEGRAAEWKPVADQPNHSGASAKTHYTCLATSPALQYVTFRGVAFARYKGYLPGDPGKWQVLINGQWIDHIPSHWRDIPPPPTKSPDYDVVKAEAERLRKGAGW